MQQADQLDSNAGVPTSTGISHDFTGCVAGRALNDASLDIEHAIGTIDLLVEQLDSIGDYGDAAARAGRLTVLGRVVVSHLEASLQRMLLAEGALAAGGRA